MQRLDTFLNNLDREMLETGGAIRVALVASFLIETEEKGFIFTETYLKPKGMVSILLVYVWPDQTGQLQIGEEQLGQYPTSLKEKTKSGELISVMDSLEDLKKAKKRAASFLRNEFEQEGWNVDSILGIMKGVDSPPVENVDELSSILEEQRKRPKHKKEPWKAGKLLCEGAIISNEMMEAMHEERLKRQQHIESGKLGIDLDGQEIIKIIPDGPADRTPIQTGDRLTAVDDYELTGDLEQDAPHLSGPPGTLARLTVERDGNTFWHMAWRAGARPDH